MSHIDFLKEVEVARDGFRGFSLVGWRAQFGDGKKTQGDQIALRDPSNLSTIWDDQSEKDASEYLSEYLTEHPAEYPWRST